MAELIEAFKNYREWPSNFAHNSQVLADSLDLKTYIRIIAIIGAYCFIRPYILKFVARTSMKQHESLEVLDNALKGDGMGRIGANAFRGGVKKGKEDDSSEEGEVTGADWGKKARKRQKQVQKQRQREEEIKMKMEDGEADDKDIMDLLVDYDEGEDGW